MNLNEFQIDVRAWMAQCFGWAIASDVRERGDRLLEEVLELLQAHGYDKTRIPTLVEYVYGRPVGDPPQEMGGVLVTLSAYADATELNMATCGDMELRRIWTKIPEIQAKQRSKRDIHGPLPGGNATNAKHAQQPTAEQIARNIVEAWHAQGKAIEYLPLDDPIYGWHDATAALRNNGFLWQDNDYRVKSDG